MKDFEYIGLVIDNDTREGLKNIIPPIDNIKMFLHHVTLLHVSKKEEYRGNIEYLEYLEGEYFPIEITHIGWSDKAMAFKVNVPFSTASKTPHMTIGTFNGASPVTSNFITNWFQLEKKIIIKGRVYIHMRDPNFYKKG